MFTVPVTIKFRMGIDESCITYLDAGRVGEQTGCKWVGLHARTAAQLYDGDARWVYDDPSGLPEEVTVEWLAPPEPANPRRNQD